MLEKLIIAGSIALVASIYPAIKIYSKENRITTIDILFSLTFLIKIYRSNNMVIIDTTVKVYGKKLLIISRI